MLTGFLINKGKIFILSEITRYCNMKGRKNVCFDLQNKLMIQKLWLYMFVLCHYTNKDLNLLALITFITAGKISQIFYMYKQYDSVKNKI